ncbi:MAG: hypothetical protein ACOCRB_02730 [Halanaerobiaceae bacterium]
MEYLFHSGHEKFNFDNIEEIKEKLNKLNQNLPFSKNYSSLFKEVSLENKIIPNSIAIQPMEGCDGSEKGEPEELTFRRYKRFGSGGAGLIWMEATAVENRARANPGQLFLNDNTASEFKKLREQTLESAVKTMGKDHKPIIVIQLTHSGRYSKPEGESEPIIAHHSQILDPEMSLSCDHPLITDKELDQLQRKYVEAATLAKEMGYDGVDIKACHGYLINELLGAYTRENSKYGGSYENRTRFLKQVIKRVKAKNPDLIVTTRLNVYDAIPYPYGFGMDQDGSMKPDLTEPIKLIRELHQLGVNMINIATGNPYYNPHVERPFDTNVKGGYIPEAHPLENVSKNMEITKKIQKKVPEAIITIASGLSWLRQYVPALGAGLKENDWCDLIGLGRMALAYPDFVKDLKEKGELDPQKICISCSSCSQLMRDGKSSGCVIRDREVYGPIYNS